MPLTMHVARALVEEAQQRAADLKVVTWDALAQEILRVVGAAQPEAESFLRGRDLAIGMLSAGDALQGDGSVEAQRRFRDGKPQERFARGPLQELIRQPELLEGFAAVLSGRLGVAEPLKAAGFDLPLAEYEPGLVGTDGTQPNDDDAHSPAPNTAAMLAGCGPTAPVRLDLAREIIAALDPIEYTFEKRRFETASTIDVVKRATDLIALQAARGFYVQQMLDIAIENLPNNTDCDRTEAAHAALEKLLKDDAQRFADLRDLFGVLADRFIGLTQGARA